MISGDNKKNDAITDEAAVWFQAMRGDDVANVTRTRFADWLVQSPAHVAEYLRLVELWDDLGDIDVARCVDVQALVAQGAADEVVAPLFGAAAGDASAAVRVGRRWRRPAAIAAALAVAAGFLWSTSLDMGSTDVYATAPGEQRSFSLDDGSIIHLNTRTEIRVRYDEHTRRVQLRHGEALFDVADDAARPFVVQDSVLVAQALGTRFNVYRRAAGTRVTVIEGSVAVSAKRRQTAVEDGGSRGPDGRIAMLPRIELQPGEQAEVGAASRRLTTSRVDIERVTAWTARRLVFDTDRLRDVVAEFNRYNQTELRLAGDALAEQQISGTFNANEPQALVDALQRLVNVDVQQLPDGALLLRLATPDAR